tara:strand:+ start:3267 stop:4175 length:909 start_codon:yes stop_codon:yes gene_type:complete
MNNEKEKKKPGRKKKLPENSENLVTNTEKNEIIHKKRGRKPKGGKIITTTEKVNDNQILKQNIILHLKCNMIEIKNVYNVDYIQSYNNNIIPFNSDIIEDNLNINNSNTFNNIEKKTDEKDIHNKIKSLASSLHSNIIPNKIADCFWCHSQFDGPPVYIPKNKYNEKFNVYGNFCSPECACAFLFNQNIDTSQKFERYQLLNHIYSGIYKYTYFIKPAPSPFYLLNKYLGNLSIEEYRKINKTNQLISIIDKPMTRNFPELFEDVDEENIKNIPNTNNSNYKLYKKSTADKNKSLSEHFNIN